jgi:hypothetical protein
MKRGDRTDLQLPPGHYVTTSRTTGWIKVRLVPFAPIQVAVSTDQTCSRRP